MFDQSEQETESEYGTALLQRIEHPLPKICLTSHPKNEKNKHKNNLKV